MSPETESPNFAVRVEGLDKVYRIRQNLHQRRWGGGGAEDLDDDDEDEFAGDEEDEKDEDAQVVTPRRIEALRAIDFEVGAGERFGIVGFTGAGKSTLLKMLSRTAPPTGGRITIARPVAPPAAALTRLFVGEETVRQNLRHMADLLRVDRETLIEAEQEMLAFAGLESHRDIVMKRWASGFSPRLSSALVLHMGARVILSEGSPLAGEPSYRERCAARIDELLAAGTSLVMTCGDPKSARACSSAIWLDEGRVRMQGTGEEVAEEFERYLLSVDPDELDPRVTDKVARVQEREAYRAARAEERGARKAARAEDRAAEKVAPVEPVRISRAVALTGDGRSTASFGADDTLQLQLTLDAPAAGRLRGRAMLVLDEGRTRRLGRHFDTVLDSAGEVQATIELPARNLPIGEVAIDLSAILASGGVATERITIEVVGEAPTLTEIRELGAPEWVLGDQR